MHEIFHIIGLCPDSFSHTSLLEVVVTNYQTINDLINTNFKSYVAKFASNRGALADQWSGK